MDRRKFFTALSALAATPGVAKVEHLSVKPSDVVVATVRRDAASAQACRRLAKQWEDLDTGAKFLVVESNVEKVCVLGPFQGRSGLD